MEPPSLQELDTLKYSELQKLAKVAGCKANLKADRLLKALKKHFYPVTGSEQSGDDSDGNCTVTEKDEPQITQEEDAQVSFYHVTERRGRGKKTQQCDPTSNESDVPGSDNAIPEGGQLQETSDVTPAEDSARPGSASKQRKRRRTEDEVQTSETTEKAIKRQSNTTSHAQPGGKIPRYIGRTSRTGPKPSTPNFKKLHEAHFKKMESIDVYMDRKKKRLDVMTHTIQEVKKSLHSKFSPRSPAPRKSAPPPPAKTPTSGPRSAASNKSILVDKSGFKPTVHLTSKMNVRFSEATKDNEHKRSLIKTPARRSSPHVPFSPSSHPERPPAMGAKNAKEPSAAMNASVMTPFKFNAPTASTPSSNKKLKFDLQASLTRPLGYQPHKGKLKPWGEAKENQASGRSNLSMLKNNYKQPPLSSRDDRRKQQIQDRKGNRDKTLGTRRGITIT